MFGNRFKVFRMHYYALVISLFLKMLYLFLNLNVKRKFV